VHVYPHEHLIRSTVAPVEIVRVSMPPTAVPQDGHISGHS